MDQFAYPNKGTGSIYTNTATNIESFGGHIHLNSPVKKVVIENQKATGIVLVNGTLVEADHIVSSMPITILLKEMDNVPQEVIDANNKLYFRNTILVYLEVEGHGYFKDNWIYVHSPDVKHGRITNFRNWSPGIIKNSDNTILCLEYWSFDTDEIWTATDEHLSSLATDELRKLNLIPSSTKILNSHIERVNKCYPVYETGYHKNLSVIIEYLNSIYKLRLIGRYGAFKYNNQDHSILMGLLCSDLINNNSQDVDLWSINTDTEYQEDKKIKDVLIG